MCLSTILIVALYWEFVKRVVFYKKFARAVKERVGGLF